MIVRYCNKLKATFETDIFNQIIFKLTTIYLKPTINSNNQYIK